MSSASRTTSPTCDNEWAAALFRRISTKCDLPEAGAPQMYTASRQRAWLIPSRGTEYPCLINCSLRPFPKSHFLNPKISLKSCVFPKKCSFREATSLSCNKHTEPHMKDSNKHPDKGLYTLKPCALVKPSASAGLPSLKLTANVPDNMGLPNRTRSASNHQFLGALCVDGSEIRRSPVDTVVSLLPLFTRISDLSKVHMSGGFYL